MDKNLEKKIIDFCRTDKERFYISVSSENEIIIVSELLKSAGFKWCQSGLEERLCINSFKLIKTKNINEKINIAVYLRKSISYTNCMTSDIKIISYELFEEIFNNKTLIDRIREFKQTL